MGLFYLILAILFISATFFGESEDKLGFFGWGLFCVGFYILLPTKEDNRTKQGFKTVSPGFIRFLIGISFLVIAYFILKSTGEDLLEWFK